MELIVRTEEVTLTNGVDETRQKQVTFTFDPNVVEIVRAKDSAYIIRQKKNLRVAENPAMEDNG